MEEKKMDKLTTEFAEYICDSLCHYPHILSKEELENKCLECKTGKFICDILNEYNRINDFDNTQTCKLLKELSKMQQLKERDTAKEPKIHKNKAQDAYICPNCNLVFIYKDETGWFCGKRYSFCPDCGQRLKWED